MHGRVLQTLLSGGEYDEFEDVVIAEGEFVETDDQHRPVRQAVLGMTPFSLLIAVRYIENYKTHPEVFYRTDADPWLDGLELAEAWPICLLRVHYSHIKYELDIEFHNKRRYFELTNTRFNTDLENTWAKWVERAVYLKEDPYGYVRAQFDRFNIPYPDYLVDSAFEEMKVRSALALRRADLEAGDGDPQDREAETALGDTSKKSAKNESKKLKMKMNLSVKAPGQNVTNKSEVNLATKKNVANKSESNLAKKKERDQKVSANSCDKKDKAMVVY